MKQERGVTLIALVVTIIVLLVLAAAAIATLTGDNGIFSNAQKYKNLKYALIKNKKYSKIAVLIERKRKEWNYK